MTSARSVIPFRTSVLVSRANTVHADPHGILAPCLYRAVVEHTRHQPVKRHFSHRVYYWLIDLDDPVPLPRGLRWMARFRAADHIGEPGCSIKRNVTDLVAAHGIDLTGGKIFMQANARTLGYVFNPISVHWCYLPTGGLACIVAEVHNTYRDRHAYVLRPDAHGRARTDKSFYVSPFLALDGQYIMRFSPPGERLSITIALRRARHTVFTARVTGTRQPATTLNALRAFATRPLVSCLTISLIRAHGVWLWARGLPVVPRQVHPEAVRQSSRGEPD